MDRLGKELEDLKKRRAALRASLKTQVPEASRAQKAGEPLARLEFQDSVWALKAHSSFKSPTLKAPVARLCSSSGVESS